MELKHIESKPPACPLRPVIGNNACPPRITAAAGTEFVACPLTWGTDYVIISTYSKPSKELNVSPPPL